MEQVSAQRSRRCTLYILISILRFHVCRVGSRELVRSAANRALLAALSGLFLRLRFGLLRIWTATVGVSLTPVGIWTATVAVGLP